MGHRISTWVGVVVVAVGLSAAAMSCAGIAMAEPSSTSDSHPATSPKPSHPSSQAVTKTDVGAAGAHHENGPRRPPKPTTSADDAAPSSTAPDAPNVTSADGSQTGAKRHARAVVGATGAKPATTDPSARAAAHADTAPAKNLSHDAIDVASVTTRKTTRTVESAAAPAQAVPLATKQALAAAAPAGPAAPTGPTLVNVIGSLVFGLLDVVTKILQGPPAVPMGSTVQVGRSTLQIDCGTGYTAQADWYFPKGPQPPTRLIYFQHGILATDNYYNATAAELAQNNDAIVVAPTITSNPFACDGCQLAGDQMHAAVAQLFLDPDRQALLASAQAAGFEGTELPTNFVLAGHSEGGQLAAGAAGYFEQFAPDDQTRHELVGVLLFDTSDDNGILPSSDGALTRALRQIPADIPVLNIAATPNFLDAYGDANAALQAARPGQFNGVQLVGGQHSDAFRTTNPIVQFVVSLGTGFSAPQNVDAVQVLAQGWINDMYAGTVYDPDQRTGYYGDPGTTIDIPTNAGTAQAYVLPAPPAQHDAIYPFYLVLRNLLLAANLDFATCAIPPDDSSVSAPLTTAVACGRDVT